MADKYVKLDDIIETLEHEWGYEGMREDLYNLPTADVVEVKRGYWKLTKTEFGWNGCEYPTEYTCTVCGVISPWCEEPYCSYCGAKMDGAKNV